jgi:Ca-activated chloride channel family protein
MIGHYGTAGERRRQRRRRLALEAHTWLLVVVTMTLVLPACDAGSQGGGTTPSDSATGAGTDTPAAKRDDWVFKPAADDQEGGSGTRPQAAPAAAAKRRIGLSAGGAKDVGNFRKNIENGFLPQPSDLTYEGLFYDYSFDTGEATACKKLFCPSYVQAQSRDPFSGQTEFFLSVGLNSGIEERDFARKKLNLVIVLDISGSMHSSFKSYYYDRFGNRRGVETKGVEKKSKMKVAAEAIVALMGHLKDHDRLGVALFDNRAYLAKPVSLLSAVDRDRLAGHIRELKPQGGTNMAAGLTMGSELLKTVAAKDPEQYENRIIFLTDAMPNLGDTSDSGLLGITRSNAAAGRFTTFIGVGVDFNTKLIEGITKIKGANYYSVHSAAEFNQRLDEEFDFMVTPLVFDLTLAVKAEGYEITAVYGSPEANQATGEIMKVNTLFPSKVEEGQTRGGVILLKLRKVADDATLVLTTSYRDRSGKQDGDQARVTFPDRDGDFFANKGARKAVLLARYADLLLNWISDVRKGKAESRPPVPSINKQRGIPRPHRDLGQWERTSVPLEVPAQYRSLLSEFKAYFEQEAAAIGDATLAKEVALMKALLDR